jgi:preprotein translocase subunit SecF
MALQKSIHTARYDTSSRLHIIVLYLLIASLTIAWGIYFVHFSRNVQTHIDSTYVELNLIKERLEALESAEITVSTNANGYDALRRQSRQTRVKAKSINNKQQQQQKGKQVQKVQQIQTDQKQQQEENPDLLFGSIHFKVPVRRNDLLNLVFIENKY